jgi:hypothetical protein
MYQAVSETGIPVAFRINAPASLVYIASHDIGADNA